MIIQNEEILNYLGTRYSLISIFIFDHQHLLVLIPLIYGIIWKRDNTILF